MSKALHKFMSLICHITYTTIELLITKIFRPAAVCLAAPSLIFHLYNQGFYHFLYNKPYQGFIFIQRVTTVPASNAHLCIHISLTAIVSSH